MKYKIMAWFMSYCWRPVNSPQGEDVSFGCCIATSEHPIEKVLRWNKELKYRRTVLLSFQEIPGGYPKELGEIDMEI